MNTDTPIVRKTIINLRDLHGITSTNNTQIKAGRLFRSANPSWASNKDSIFLQSLNLTHLVDFRSDLEKKPEKEAIFNQHFSKFAQPIELGDLVSDRILNKIKTLTKKEVHAYMCHLNHLFVTQYQEQFKAFLKLLEKGDTILFHCTAGKDRTGFAALLLLSALGIDQETIMANYLESNLYTKAIFQDSDEHARALGIDLDIYSLFQRVEADYLATAQKTINQEFGGMEHYLRTTLGVNIEAIQAHYLE